MFKLNFTGPLLICLLIIGGDVCSQTIKKIDDATWNAINNEVAAAYALYNLKGISVAVVYGGNIAYANAFGNKNDDGDPFTIYTKSLLASISKTITGVLAMRLVQNGDLNLDDALSQHFSDYSGSGITIRDLFTHQSGIAHYSNCPGGYSGPFNASDSYDVVVDCEICMTPAGSGTLYTTFGNTLLGIIVNNIGVQEYGVGYSGLYNAWMRDPGNLGTLQPAWDSNDPDLAEGSVDDSWDDIGWKLPAGGFKSNIIDLANYTRGLLNNVFITDSTFDVMKVLQNPGGGANFSCGTSSGSDYGLSFGVSGSNPNATNFFLSHSGENDHGYSSLMRIYPNRNASIVILTNTIDALPAMNAIMSGISGYVLCPASRDFTNNIDWTEPRIFEGIQITGRSEITSTYNDQYVFDSQELVRLLPGFKASAGKMFWAIATDGCAGTILTD